MSHDEAMTLHPQLEADTIPVCLTPNAHVLLMNDSRWPWFILVPRLANINELHEFSDKQRGDFMSDANLLSKTLQNSTQCQSVNVAMLGNVVAQLHCHVIARNANDPNWPRPVWGFESAIAYNGSQPQNLMNAVARAFDKDQPSTRAN